MDLLSWLLYAYLVRTVTVRWMEVEDEGDIGSVKHDYFISLMFTTYVRL